MRRRVDRPAWRPDPTRAVEALETRLRADEIAADRLMRAGQLAEHRELPGSLEDPPVEGSRPKLLGQAVGISPVVLLSAALRHPRHHGLVDVWAQNLVQPGALGTLLEDPMLAAGNLPDGFHQRSTVCLHHLCLQLLARCADHHQRRTRGMDPPPPMMLIGRFQERSQESLSPEERLSRILSRGTNRYERKNDREGENRGRELHGTCPPGFAVSCAVLSFGSRQSTSGFRAQGTTPHLNQAERGCELVHTESSEGRLMLLRSLTRSSASAIFWETTHLRNRGPT